MTIALQGRTYHFDCFECAIQVLAPLCTHCGTTIIGHGTQEGEKMFCCEHCARAEAGKVKESA